MYVTVTWSRLYCVFTYIYSLLIEKDIFDCRNVPGKLPCVYLYLSSWDLFFSVSFLFLLLFLCYPYFSTFPFHVVSLLYEGFYTLECYDVNQGMKNVSKYTVFINSSLLPGPSPGASSSQLSRGAISTVHSHTFILFWLRKTSVSVETYQPKFHVLF